VVRRREVEDAQVLTDRFPSELVRSAERALVALGQVGPEGKPVALPELVEPPVQLFAPMYRATSTSASSVSVACRSSRRSAMSRVDPDVFR
jgi:hypothetical protein